MIFSFQQPLTYDCIPAHALFAKRVSLVAAPLLSLFDDGKCFVYSVALGQSLWPCNMARDVLHFFSLVASLLDCSK